MWILAIRWRTKEGLSNEYFLKAPNGIRGPISSPTRERQAKCVGDDGLRRLQPSEAETKNAPDLTGRER
jgi:hypothetical protein